MIRRAPAVALLLGLFLAGCGGVSQQSASGAVDDGLLYAQVEARFAGIDPDSALHVAVSVHGGDVSLSGKAKSQTIAERFEAAAKDVPGVKNVHAQLSVDPKLPSSTRQAQDFATAAAVMGNVVAQAGVNALSVRAAASGGVVTVRGSVKTGALKSTVLDAASHAPGVKRVVDRLEVKP